MSALAILVGNAVAMPIAGRLIDRWGELRVSAISGMLLGLAFVLIALLTHGLISFLLLIVALSFVSAGANLVAYNRVIVRHFVARRGLALGLAMTGTVIGAALMPPLLAPFIVAHGWRAAYGVLAAMAIGLTAVAALMLQREPLHDRAPRSVQVPWQEVVRHSAFVRIAIIIFLAACGVLGTTMHLVPLLSDRGMDAVSAGKVASVLGIAVLLGRIVTGQMLDRFDAGVVTALLLSLAAIGALLLWRGGPAPTIAGVVLVGFGLGTEADLLAYLLGRRFPLRSFGSAYGAILAVHAVGGGLGGYLAGLSVDWTGGYGAWLAMAAMMLIAAGVIAWCSERGFIPNPTMAA